MNPEQIIKDEEARQRMLEKRRQDQLAQLRRISAQKERDKLNVALDRLRGMRIE